MNTSTIGHTTKYLFQRAIELELAAADLYTELAKRFYHHEEISKFWNDLHKDEMIHAEELRKIQKGLTEEQLSKVADAKAWEETETIKRWVSRDLIGPMQTLDDAFSLAHELETSEFNSVFKLLAQKFIPSEKRRNFIILEINKHQNKLIYFNENFGDRTWRQQVLIQKDEELDSV